jgi:hypothetical protein
MQRVHACSCPKTFVVPLLQRHSQLRACLLQDDTASTVFQQAARRLFPLLQNRQTKDVFSHTRAGERAFWYVYA